jgi:glucosamine--fructose-6-phosphate aminotransferase (isomerizing)
MYKMIKEQPEAIQYTMDNCAEMARRAAEVIGNKRVYLTGCGSSFHAAMYGEFVLRSFGFDAIAVHALDMIHYTPMLKNSTAIVISHSWRTRTTLQALDVLNGSKVPCIGITANEQAENKVDIMMRASEGYDESDCVTMGYTTELAALALIAECNGERKHMQNIPRLVTEALDREHGIKELAYEFHKCRRFFALGAGPNVSTAYEMALKMKEGNFTDAEAMQVEQMLHGSISGVDEGDTVFLIAPKDSKVRQRMYEAAQALNAIGAVTVAVTDGADEIERECRHSFNIGYCPEYLNPIASIVPLHLFAYYIAEKNGVDPDLTREDDPRYRKAYATVLLHLK